jgi:hypothetical protein
MSSHNTRRTQKWPPPSPKNTTISYPIQQYWPYDEKGEFNENKYKETQKDLVHSFNSAHLNEVRLPFFLELIETVLRFTPLLKMDASVISFLLWTYLENITKLSEESFDRRQRIEAILIKLGSKKDRLTSDWFQGTRFLWREWLNLNQYNSDLDIPPILCQHPSVIPLQKLCWAIHFFKLLSISYDSGQWPTIFAQICNERIDFLNICQALLSILQTNTYFTPTEQASNSRQIKIIQSWTKMNIDFGKLNSNIMYIEDTPRFEYRKRDQETKIPSSTLSTEKVLPLIDLSNTVTLTIRGKSYSVPKGYTQLYRVLLAEKLVWTLDQTKCIYHDQEDWIFKRLQDLQMLTEYLILKKVAPGLIVKPFILYLIACMWHVSVKTTDEKIQNICVKVYQAWMNSSWLLEKRMDSSGMLISYVTTFIGRNKSKECEAFQLLDRCLKLLISPFLDEILQQLGITKWDGNWKSFTTTGKKSNKLNEVLVRFAYSNKDLLALEQRLKTFENKESWLQSDDSGLSTFLINHLDTIKAESKDFKPSKLDDIEPLRCKKTTMNPMKGEDSPERIKMILVDQCQKKFLNVSFKVATARIMLINSSQLFDTIHAGGNTQLCTFLFPDGKPDPSWMNTTSNDNKKKRDINSKRL